MNLHVGKAELVIDQPALIEITDQTLPLLDRMLRKVDRIDPFSKSAGYYAMTGRRGLWLYGDDDTAMVVARHPNKDNTILFFPPFGQNALGLIKLAMVDERIPDGEIQLARVGRDDMHLSMMLQAEGINAPHAEDILDWTYPVHVVSAEKIIERKGGAFNNFRAHVNQAFRAGYEGRQIDPEKDYEAVLQIVDQWAKDGKKDGYTYDDLTTPTKSLLSLMKDRLLTLGGVIVHHGDDPVGFWIWDQADQAGRTAMSLARVSVGGHGAAEFAGLKMAEILKAQGFETICLGGSETQSLDKFKRKMVPTKSIELQTMQLSPR